MEPLANCWKLCRARLLIARNFTSPSPTGKKIVELSDKTIKMFGESYVKDEMTNISPVVLQKVARRLLHVPHHPLNILKQRIFNYFHKTFVSRRGQPLYTAIDNVLPVVSTEQNFSSLAIPKGHPLRSKSDNYYINSEFMLRTHTSAHQRDFIRSGLDRFLVAGDVYRRDEIDSKHYPVFHQMEGVGLFTSEELFGVGHDPSLSLFEPKTSDEDHCGRQQGHTQDAVQEMERNLKNTLTGLVRYLFGKDIQTQWVACTFPFTHPSYELEVQFQGEWLEVLGSGVMRQSILESGGATGRMGWAFGLGLDRLAMLLCNISDIRLLWSEDERFISQFKKVTLNPATDIKFVPFSKYPACYKDISFWLNNEFIENDFFELARQVGGDWIEKVELIDHFRDPTSTRESRCYRLTYRSMDQTITNEAVNKLQDQLREETIKLFDVNLR